LPVRNEIAIAAAAELWILEPHRRGDLMLSRAAAALLVLAMAALLGSAEVAQAQFDNEREQMLSGGSPKKRNYNLFGFDGSALGRTTVSYSTTQKPGTIVINTAERRLYLVQDNGWALRYGIGVGRVGFTWKGTHKITAKREWPGWTPPPQMRARQKGLPAHMAGGEDNPLGARAMYLGSTLYRIHGSNDPDSIGEAESSGCFRMTNEDVKDLYNRVSIGTTVVVQ
jgi:lipoprotein-anchoring transpeptidase ErfK/SrfK